VTDTPTLPRADTVPATEPEHRWPGTGRIFLWCLAGAAALLAITLLASAVYAIRAVLVQVVIALFVAVSLDPMVRWMIARRIKRSHAVAIISLAAFAIFVALLWAVTPSLISQANSLITDFPGYVGRLRDRSPGLRALEDRLNAQATVDAWVQALPGRVAAEAVGFATRFFGAVLSVLLVVVLTIYLMLDLPRLRRGLVRLFPKAHRPQVTEVINLVIDKVGSYMIGNLLISAIAGVTAFVVLSALRVPFALPLALVVAVTDLIPLIGATLGAAISLIVCAATTPLWPTTVLVGLFFLVYQQIENYVIAPRVVRNTVDISSIAVLLAALIGASVLGVVGAVIAIPVAATIKVVLSDRLRARDEAAARHTPLEIPTDLPTPRRS
jgi:predicted PurR-regulated permease PerM